MSLLLKDRVWSMEAPTAKRGVYPLHGFKLGLYRLPIKLEDPVELKSVHDGLKKAFENLKQFKHIILFEDIENDLKKFINENNLDIKSIPNIDYNSTKKNYDNYDFKKIAEFYNPYDLILYKRVKEEILKKL